MHSAGINAAQGLVKGLESQSKKLDAAAEKLANSLVSQVKKSLGIKSPSRVFRDQIGAQLIPGIDAGLNPDPLLAKLNRLGEAITEAALPASPVGLSGALPGAALGRSSVGVATSAGASDSDKLQRILEVLTTYLPGFANLQVSLDSGALVGQLAPGVDVALGDIRNRKGRGNR